MEIGEGGRGERELKGRLTPLHRRQLRHRRHLRPPAPPSTTSPPRGGRSVCNGPTLDLDGDAQVRTIIIILPSPLPPLLRLSRWRDEEEDKAAAPPFSQPLVSQPAIPSRFSFNLDPPLKSRQRRRHGDPLPILPDPAEREEAHPPQSIGGQEDDLKTRASLAILTFIAARHRQPQAFQYRVTAVLEHAP